MGRNLTLGMLLILTFRFGQCQDAAKVPSFEVASVTPCKPGTPAPPGEHAGMVRFTYPGGRLRANATTLKFLLEWAYDIQPSQHSGGPSWMDTDRYDVVAKASDADANASEAQMKRMTQALLEERFQLKFRREKRELSVLVLSAGKTAPKLFPPKDGETHTLQVAPQMGPDQKIVSYRVSATRFSLTQLTDTFARQLGRVMVNKTGLEGDFDFTLDLTPDESRPNPLDPSLLIDAMRQLGLSLNSQKVPVDFLTIESADKVVAEN